ncbi:hypothetical protein [Pseudomonas syringae]|uniref:hypothetical protein n=1 Tax=Pseudomonas syringae TaxID=317 RepID=UPI0003601DF6|nr:hypothetical protein [Pseudomonas syringae]MDU8540423.1 hypothetical protein [Pseudomonas syringae pv. actinidiae]
MSNRNLKALFIAAFVALGAISSPNVLAATKDLEIKVEPSPGFTGDGGKWRVTVTTSYFGESHDKLLTKPAFSMDVESGQCVKGESRTLNMRPDFKAIVSNQMCIGIVNDKIEMAGWLTSDYPTDIRTDFPHQEESQFVYGSGFRSSMDKKSSYLKAETGVFRVEFQRLN